ncbi:MAG: hypothetical protein WCN88_05355 [Candidatus Falkowbacteria bacterium]
MLPKIINKKTLLNLGYIIFFSLFLIIVYYLTNYFFATFFARAGSNINLSTQEEKTAEGNTSENALNNKQSGDPSSLIFSSFFDSFASNHLIDETATSMYRDDLVTAVYFPPLYSFELAPIDIITKNKKNIDDIYLNDFLRPLNIIDKRCLVGKCLEQRGARLIYEGKSLSLPEDINDSDIAGLSIGALEKNWLIGVTLKDGVNYLGRIYSFDGSKFTALSFGEKIEKISSSYFGLFGFGGAESDFLVIYGAYRGLAYRFQAGHITDISKFFDFRVMATGFKPEIIRATNGDLVYWYVYSSSLARPHLIKLWQNKRGEIIGEADFRYMFSDTGEAASFKLMNTSDREFVLLARLKKETTETFKIFSDRGFDNKMPGELIFNPIGVDSEIIIKTIANSKLGSPTAPCLESKFSFSTDNKNWQELPCGENLNFANPVKNNYFLRVDFPAQSDKFYSPFLDEVLFDFYYQK